MSFLPSILCCLGDRTRSKAEPTINFDNQLNCSAFHPKYQPTAENRRLSNPILATLSNAEKNGRELERTLQQIVAENGWTENLAAAVLSGLEAALREGAPMGQAMKESFNKTVDAAVDFAREHPAYFALIAIGILVLMAPWAIEALGWISGFEVTGPVEGSFAAWWQARYVGYVPKGSLFSFFQRLGMTWGR